MASEWRLPAAQTSRRQPGVEENPGGISAADDSRRLELRQAEPRRRAHIPLRVPYGADTPFADAAALSRALHLFQAGIGLPAPRLIDAGSTVTAIWRLAAGIPVPLSERCTWQLQWLWGAFKLEQAAGAPLIYDLPPGPVLPVKAPEDEAGSRPEPERERTGACVLAPGDGPQPPGLIASRLAAAEDAVLEAGYRRALVLDPRPLSW